MWCPYNKLGDSSGALNHVLDGHISASFISDLPTRRLWQGCDGIGYIYDGAALARAVSGKTPFFCDASLDYECETAS